MKSLNSFTLKSKLEEMIIYSDTNRIITLKDILERIQYLDEPTTLKFDNLDIELKITNINECLFSFSFGDVKGENILKKPLIIIIKNDKKEIISDVQFHYIIRKYYKNPYLNCSCGKKTEVSIRQIRKHIGHKICILEFFEEISPLSEFDAKLEISKHPNLFLNMTFRSPSEFEKNFNYYFIFRENREEWKGAFHIFDDENESRCYIVYEFLENYTFGNKINYFGASGKGKSITLIGALKYSTNHETYGTLYVNCKTLNALLENKNYQRIRGILMDEILFLFYQNYDNYLDCYEKIMSFNFYSFLNFWPLIEKIIEECEKINKKFIIGFDQYNDSIDSEHYLGKLEKKYLKNNEKFKFIVISSINETDIRQQKINYLFENNKNKNIIELESVCDNFQTYFKNYYLEAFNKLGKTFKAYNEILLIEGENEVKKYINEKKRKYLFKLFRFYKEDKKEKFNTNLTEENIMDASDNNYEKLLSFQMNYNYSMSDIIQIISNVPFKYFNIKRKNMQYIIEPGFPLMTEIMEDIYKYIVIKKSFNAIKNISNKRGSAFSSLFEYRVRYNFNPTIKGDINYFKNFTIQDFVYMEAFIPKKNEKKEHKFIKELEFGKSYLVEQKQFGGKDLDFLIINMLKEPEVFGFQVSTYKSEIFTSLSHSYKLLLKILKISFNIKIKPDHAYFGYIFDYSRKNDIEYESMLKDCRIYNMKYSFYNFDNNILYDASEKETHDIFNIVGKPKIKENDNEIKYYNTINLDSYNSINEVLSKYRPSIIDILRRDTKDTNIIDLDFAFRQKYIPFQKGYVSIPHKCKENMVVIFYLVNDSLISKIIYSDGKVEDNSVYFSNLFDVYIIIKKTFKNN